MTDWQPIETAPKDGSDILVWLGSAEDGMQVAYWSTSPWVGTPYRSGGWVVYEARSDTWELSPTHWRPLPEPPSVAQVA